MRVIKKIDLNMNLTCCDALGENIIEKVINEYVNQGSGSKFLSTGSPILNALNQPTSIK